MSSKYHLVLIESRIHRLARYVLFGHQSIRLANAHLLVTTVPRVLSHPHGSTRVLLPAPLLLKSARMQLLMCMICTAIQNATCIYTNWEVSGEPRRRCPSVDCAERFGICACDDVGCWENICHVLEVWLEVITIALRMNGGST